VTKGEQTRQNIVAAAAPIFNQHGYEGSSLTDLMAASGLKKVGADLKVRTLKAGCL
jgi:TetR/AcrR family transcriptional repressor of nem operon